MDSSHPHGKLLSAYFVEFPPNPLSPWRAVDHHRSIPRTITIRNGWEAAQKRGGHQSLFVEREATLERFENK